MHSNACVPVSKPEDGDCADAPGKNENAIGMNPIPSKSSLFTSKCALLLTGLIVVTGLRLAAQPITVPNFSFESQIAPASYPYVNVNVDSWQKAPEPTYYGPA